MTNSRAPFAADVAAIQNIAAVPTILAVVCRTTRMGFAAVARVTENHWVACGVRDTIGFGLQPGDELEVATTICNEIRESGQTVAIDHAARDEAFCGHPTPAQYGFQSYISTPIVMPDGRFFGTLCALDPQPATVNTPETIGMLRLFAELIAFQLDAHERLARGAARLHDEQRNAELREQFIAILGHDLRNPIASIGAGVKLLQRTPLDDQARQIASMMQASVNRMSGLINNVLDFARGRLGGGFQVTPSSEPIEPALQQVVAELRAAHPGRWIETQFAISAPLECDGARVAQLLSNLLANALTHGSHDAPVTVRAATVGDAFELSVANTGDPIPPAVLEKLFQPFERMAAPTNQEGLGLGLYIASEIARAHGGALDVESTPERTVFTFRMPATTDGA
jgi:signal transduction histidine kinase